MSVKEPKPKKTNSLCGGCYNEEYWHGLGGAKECWSFKSAKIEKRLAIPSYLAPPYDKDHAQYRLNCFNKKGMVYVKPEALTSEGFWR